jgi:hypothetical protein
MGGGAEVAETALLTSESTVHRSASQLGDGSFGGVAVTGLCGVEAKRQTVSEFVQRWPSSRPRSSSCGFLVQHRLVEIVADDLLQQVA